MKDNTTTTFSLYNNKHKKIQSTIFDLIPGYKEPKQTNGLAYIISKRANILKKISMLPQVRKEIKKVLGKDFNLINNINYISVDSQQMSDSKPIKIRDITISCYSDKCKSIDKKFLIIVIEAKNIKYKTNVKEIKTQLKEYMDNNKFLSDGNTPKIFITLTKDKILDDNCNVVGITWIDIINILCKEIEDIKEDIYLRTLLDEYYRFITGVDKNMKVFDKEILSVPAQITGGLIEKYSIHACPVDFNYKKPLFITFRQNNDGEMNCLYQIDDVIVLNPHGNEYEYILSNSNVEYKDRLNSYIKDRKEKWEFDKEIDLYKFYILSEDKIIHLKHRPVNEKKGARGTIYYTLAEVLSGKKYIRKDS